MQKANVAIYEHPKEAEHRSAQDQLLPNLQPHYPIERRGIKMMVERDDLSREERRSIYMKRHKGTMTRLAHDDEFAIWMREKEDAELIG